MTDEAVTLITLVLKKCHLTFLKKSILWEFVLVKTDASFYPKSAETVRDTRLLKFSAFQHKYRG